MGRILKYLFYIVAIGSIGLVGYAIFSDLPAPTDEIVIPVTPSENE